MHDEDIQCRRYLEDVGKAQERNQTELECSNGYTERVIYSLAQQERDRWQKKYEAIEEKYRATKTELRECVSQTSGL
ncbi:hypothetical protein DFH07DRAFT_959730 [Mycena maculata]|uniref:Uncharacterized protein n=1 Tax=Mycena maculata TaxID=230809 RepID=A0AAD7J561_9AGAR|nr:hypothetical protein DFH07DRAFT_959730 [Mycena maculata]